jgi:hypothetical protein
LSISTVSVPWHFRWNFDMNRSNVAISSVQHYISVGLIDRQYWQYPLYLKPSISFENPIWTLATWAYIEYSILITRALLKVNIVNIHCIGTLTFPLKLRYEASQRGHHFSTAFYFSGSYWSSILSISTVSAPWHFRFISNMNRSNVAIPSIRHSNSEGLIERQYCQYPLYRYPNISVETSIWTVATWPSLQYSILFQWPYWTSILSISTVFVPWHFRWNSNMNRSNVNIFAVHHSN